MWIENIAREFFIINEHNELKFKVVFQFITAIGSVNTCYAENSLIREDDLWKVRHWISKILFHWLVAKCDEHIVGWDFCYIRMKYLFMKRSGGRAAKEEETLSFMICKIVVSLVDSFVRFVVNVVPQISSEVYPSTFGQLKWSGFCYSSLNGWGCRSDRAWQFIRRL